MSYIYLLESGEESSVDCFSAIAPSVLSRLNPIAERYCSNGSATASCPDSLYGTTCEPSTVETSAVLPMSSAADSLARTSVWQEKAQALMVNAVDYGAKWPASLARFDPATSLWRTAQHSLFGGLAEFSETWPCWGMMRAGECWARGTRVPFTNGIGSGLLALPTICKSEFRGAGRKRYVGSKDFRGAKMSEALRTCLADPIYLHPCFAELAMGFPITWTELAPLAMHRFQAWLHSHGRHWRDV